MSEISQWEGQVWVLADTFDTDDCVTVESCSRTLVLCDLMRIMSGPRAGMAIHVPVTFHDLPRLSDPLLNFPR